MVLNEAMAVDGFLGKGIYLLNTNDLTDIIFVNSAFRIIGRALKKKPEYVIMNHPSPINKCISAIIEKMISKFSDDFYVEHDFGGVVNTYHNILKLHTEGNALQVFYYNEQTIKSVVLSSNYKICNMNSDYSIIPKYLSVTRSCFSGNYYIGATSFSIGTLNKMLRIVYGK